jgi:hypothetical protein
MVPTWVILLPCSGIGDPAGAADDVAAGVGVGSGDELDDGEGVEDGEEVGDGSGDGDGDGGGDAVIDTAAAVIESVHCPLAGVTCAYSFGAGASPLDCVDEVV